MNIFFQLVFADPKVIRKLSLPFLLMGLTAFGISQLLKVDGSVTYISAMSILLGASARALAIMPNSTAYAHTVLYLGVMMTLIVIGVITDIRYGSLSTMLHGRSVLMGCCTCYLILFYVRSIHIYHHTIRHDSRLPNLDGTIEPPAEKTSGQSDAP